MVHFAARKYVNESVEDPLRYYDHNVCGTVNLARAMQKHGVKKLVFSSSCTVYGNPQRVPIDESHPLCAVSPYGRTKIINEDIFRDLHASDKEWRIVLLRYFNPVGAHPSGEGGRGGHGGVQGAWGVMPGLKTMGGGVTGVLCTLVRTCRARGCRGHPGQCLRRGCSRLRHDLRARSSLPAA